MGCANSAGIQRKDRAEVQQVAVSAERKAGEIGSSVGGDGAQHLGRYHLKYTRAAIAPSAANAMTKMSIPPGIVISGVVHDTRQDQTWTT
jgi:hypothetical protein